MSEKMRTAIAYARYSDDQQREESLTAQLRAIHEYAKKNKITVIREYTDEAKSATTDDRPGFLRMLDAPRSPLDGLTEKMVNLSIRHPKSLYRPFNRPG